uniref:Partial Capsid Protein n=1 Tax=Sapporo virus-Houston/90 TaxID=336066 RepID=O70698_9CALI|nr:unknown [Sapporo virus-Houston/90]
MAPNCQPIKMVAMLARMLIRLVRLARPHPMLLYLIQNNPMGPRNAWKWLLLLVPSNQMSLKRYQTALRTAVLLLGMTECPLELFWDLYRFIPTLIHTHPTFQACGQDGEVVLKPASQFLGLACLLGGSLLLSYHLGLTPRRSGIRACFLTLSLMLVSLIQYHL